MLSLKQSQRRQRHGAPSGKSPVSANTLGNLKCPGPWPFVDLDDEVGISASQRAFLR